MKQEGKEANTGHINEQVTAVGTQGSARLGTQEEQKSEGEREADLPGGGKEMRTGRSRSLSQPLDFSKCAEVDI